MAYRTSFLCLLAIGTFSLPVVAQETYIFNRGFRPGIVYTTRATLSNDMAMSAPGGMSVMKGTTQQEFDFTTTAGAAAGDGTFEVVMAFGKGVATVDMQGMKQTVDLTEKLAGLEVTGTCSEGGTVESVEVTGVDIDEMLKQLGPQLLKDNQIRYPTEPMAIGTSFEQSTPLDIPLQGVGIIKGVVESTFKLASVEGDLATFEVAQKIGIESGSQAGDGTRLEGSGSGVIVYSFSDRFERSARQNTTMRIKMSTAGNAFTMDVTSQLEQHNTVRAAGAH
jgi:hypothetical protein